VSEEVLGYVVLQWNQDHWQFVSGSFHESQDAAQDYLDRWQTQDSSSQRYVVAKVVSMEAL
jgi:hypothetical protein